jgi:hypothetical protein
MCCPALFFARKGFAAATAVGLKGSKIFQVRRLLVLTGLEFEDDYDNENEKARLREAVMQAWNSICR